MIGLKGMIVKKINRVVEAGVNGNSTKIF